MKQLYSETTDVPLSTLWEVEIMIGISARPPRKARGRHDLSGARSPASFPKAQLNVRTSLIAVDDPGELVASQSGAHAVRQEGQGRVIVKVNRRVDVLEIEHHHRNRDGKTRISDAAFFVGRFIQEIFQSARGPSGGGQWREGDRVDAKTASDNAVANAIDSANDIIAIFNQISRSVGRIDANIIRAVLAENAGFATIAAARGQSGPRGVNRVAERFRESLEDLAKQWQVRGAPTDIGAWCARMMAQAAEYDGVAENFRTRARRALAKSDQERLLDSAQTWEMLARARRRLISNKDPSDRKRTVRQVRSHVLLAAAIAAAEALKAGEEF